MLVLFSDKKLLFESTWIQLDFLFLSLPQKDLTEIVNDKVTTTTILLLLLLYTANTTTTTTTTTTIFLLIRSPPKRFT